MITSLTLRMTSWGGADTMDELLDHFEEFLKMCLEAGITLNPAKIRIGFEQ